MDIREIIDQLQRLEGPSRRLDGEIAQVVGWKKKVEAFKDPKTGETRERLLWLVPSNNDEGIIPRYTLNINDAYDLAQELAPNNIGGCSWEPGKGTAIINDGTYCQAASPPIALCIAALKAIQNP
ncbi:hypothetical protein [Sinorhizobium fredii]|uniref:hypothetical protein n=1 Tax=Rhizobium fredii TaxID=380 RepID=UPI00055B578F|nr:hypothetical protein [Sinorhizobium fredii]